MSTSFSVDKRRQPTTTSRCRPRLDEIICGLKETLIMLKPWTKLYEGIPPKAHDYKKAFGRLYSAPPPIPSRSGVFTLVDGRMTTKIPDTLYISRPIIPQGRYELALSCRLLIV